ncbi:sugar phosphate isomerase/epimerase family protein [Flavilitoribacter nigricans]|uniref:Xylose isomerase n=1 Tax=Flavilitoribacter nigricans (strain ATCC 23147 / DSM 23189 / NBRC 102662 / NCIMB 1420 / SS-2) TaxID=1122177 RepID=A0A2D0NB64_FLAN2|nr:sugar phosphate isomerase/epimerase family protein [Flavilitoribacter nigricans]PHN05600.1 xylose isomerase [Flavilitoribacter nigricans DSM 23189 = NBRC 102662]
MNQRSNGRRKALASLAAIGGTTLLSSTAYARERRPEGSPKKDKTFTFCLNTSTIMGQKQGIVKDIQTAAKAGYDGVEIWINALQQYLEDGGNLRDLKMMSDDLGIKIENAIGFAPWVVDDVTKRKAGLEQAKKEMDMLAGVGCYRLAAPPAGATDIGGLDLDAVAERFCDLIEVGKDSGVIPQLEVWGFSKNLSQLKEVLYVAAGCGHKDVRILPDIYHLYRGGSGFDSLQLISGKAIEVFHMNDYPSSIAAANIQDKDRIYPGEGNAPTTQVIKTLQEMGGPKVLSLELFNRGYWEQDALKVAKTGLKRMKDVVKTATKA